MTAPAAFDDLARRYDALWTATPAGRAQRDLVWRHTDPLFGAGDAVLDIGCGTGKDAAHFAARGIAVHATDASPAMIREAARRGGFTAEVMRAEDLAEAPGHYDGAFSNFGALNCVEDLTAVSAALAALVRPGGRVAICVIGRFCLWEMVYYALRLQFASALRRVRHRTVMSRFGVRVHYRSARQLRDAFAPRFVCQRWMGIGLLAPPSYVSLPGALVRCLGALDRVFAALPVLRGMADHRLMILVRK